MANSTLTRLREFNSLQQIKNTFSGPICIFSVTTDVFNCKILVEMLSASAVSDSAPIWANFDKLRYHG